MIAAIGATGAVLAGGAVGFVFLIGVVSFNAYPKASDEVEGPAAELQVVPLTAAAPAGSPAQTADTPDPFDPGPVASAAPLPTSGGAVAGPPDLGRDISEPKTTGDEPPVVVVAPPAPGDGGSSDPTTGAGSEEPLPQDPGGGDDDPIVEPSPDPGVGQPGGSPPSRPLEPNTPNTPPPPPVTVPSTPQTGASTGDEPSAEDQSSSAGVSDTPAGE